MVAVCRLAQAHSHCCAVRNGWLMMRKRLSRVLMALLLSGTFSSTPAWALDEREIADAMATMLRVARTVISDNQSLINSKTPVSKGLTGDVVVGRVAALFSERTGVAWDQSDAGSRMHRYLGAQIQAIREVVDEHQSTINKPGIGFKGFVPAVFARLVNERFKVKMGEEVQIKVTAPLELVRNRKARPDPFEVMVIDRFLSDESWPTDGVYTARVESDTGGAFRILVPEYYRPACLNCHGGPRGELDITGHPKEGAKLGDLGGVISFQFFDQDRG